MHSLSGLPTGGAQRHSPTTQSTARWPGLRSGLMPWILAIGAALTYLLNILVDNAALFHDEYVYKAAADHRLPQDELYAKGAIEYIPNRLFVLIYRLASYSEQNFYVAAQFINVAFWALGLLAVCKLAQLLGVTGRRLLVFTALAVLLPFSTYTKYFMPEAMFFFLFAVCALLLFKAMFSGSQLLMFGAGLAAGLTYYVKPHAVMFFGATLLFLAASGGGATVRWRRVCWHGAGFMAVLLVGTLVIDKPQSLARLGVYDGMVKGMMATAVAIVNEPGGSLRAVGTVGLGHVVLVLSTWTIAVAFAVSACVALLRGKRASDPEHHQRQLFGAWLLIVTGTLFAVAIAFTVLVAEVGRIHSRYYCFMYPFLLLAVFVFEPSQYSRSARFAISAVVVVLGLALLGMPRYSGILGISLVSDSPELGFAFLSRWLAGAGIVLLVAAQLWAIWRRPQALWLVLAILFAGSHYYVRQAQGHVFRGPYTDGRDAAAVEQILGPEALRAALVVGDGRDAVSKFLFNLSVVPFVGQRPFEQVGTLIEDYPNIDTFILLTDEIEGVPGLRCEKMGQRLRVMQCVKN